MKKKTKILLVAAVSIALVILFGNKGFMDAYRSYKEIGKKSEMIEHARYSLDSLQTEYIHLKQDTSYIEQIAREKLGMAGKNELIIKFVEEE
ncbi:hypothetical protein CHISP_2017 [Chitinispirillum alkaliphilum]|nr:hypothetical protein CHISP_2017 [Chitinispirillum alkaliphilum]